MEEKRVQTPGELLAERKWMDFLRSLSVGETRWRVENYRDFISLRTSASILTNKNKYAYRFNFTQSAEDPTVFTITTSLNDGKGNS